MCWVGAGSRVRVFTKDVHVAAQAKQCCEHGLHTCEETSVLSRVIASVVSDESNVERGHVLQS